MPLHVLDDKLWFPQVADAMDDGLLAIGGDVTKERLMLAYKLGIFPWYENDIPLWWYPNPRFVLFPGELKVSHSMKNVFNKNMFKFTINKDFKAVIANCQQAKRIDQDGTWINEDIIAAYTQLHEEGYAHSAEAWQNGELVGGLYGVKLGKVFFGESMFSTVSNASKFAFIHFVKLLQQDGIELIDCQVYTSHLESLGAHMIDASTFAAYL